MPADQTRRTTGRTWPLRATGAALCLAVAAIHVIDQGGIPGSKTPAYVGDGYYALEIIGAVTALLLIAGVVRAGWFLTAGVAAGPFVGYVLSRGPGLPGYTSDVGNWTEPLGLVSLAVEAALFALAATLLLRGTWPGQPALGRLAGREAGRGRERRADQPGPAWSARSSSESVAPSE
jgi:hypothetical protein